MPMPGFRMMDAANMPPLRGFAGLPHDECYKYVAPMGL
ncbi:Uncharacterized protein dnm_007110 [Desulfonema magnum]|uniref:Uncharacterized protein n=1 Tax=Desulfonema magnum TaxID=45655 RepID=A0A975BFT6_9BACT|nr:Uncharacterized protein dnm_007110 [Desulfonema magnum]